MKLTFEGIKDTAAWQSAGVKLPEYDVQAAAEKAKAHPVWAHFGAGNIFRIFVGGLADTLIAKGEMDRGITCVETFDFDVVDKIYAPYDNLVLAVTLNADATTDKRVLGSLSEAIKAQSGVPEAWSRLKAVFADPSLQMVSFTITEKGYAVNAAVKEDMVLWAIWRDAGLSLTEGDLENCRQLWLQTYGYESEADMPAAWDDASIAQSLQRLAVERKVKTLLLQSAVEE